MTVLGVSLKMYMSRRQTLRWAGQVRDVVTSRAAGVEIFVLPSFPVLEPCLELLAGSGVGVGAQDVAGSTDGARTGEVSAAMLAELGCGYVAVGHAERRRRFGEDDVVVAAKTAQACGHGLVPVICVGEPDRVGPQAAAQFCADQLVPALAACSGARAVVAYEPVWAIGAERPAPVEHVRAVAQALRPQLGGLPLIYGGSAGPGLFADLAGCVDGLFLGRFAHDPEDFAAVLDQMLALRAGTPSG